MQSRNSQIDKYFILIVLHLVLLCNLHSNANAQQIAKTYSLNGKSAFTENNGQIADEYGIINKNVRYIYSAPGFKVLMQNNKISYEVVTYNIKNTPEPDFSEATGIRNNVPFNDLFDKQAELITNIHRVDVSFIGANLNPEIVPEEKSTDFKNFYLAHTPEKGINQLYSYYKLTYKNIYPKIDLVFYAKEEGLFKYDIIVHPGGKLDDVKMKYTGAEGIMLSNEKLEITTSQGKISEQIPVSFLKENGKIINVKHVLKNNLVTFYSQYNRTKTLVVDPSITWGTYYGGMGEEYNGSMSMDSDKNIYFAGTTTSTSSIATTGAYKTTMSGNLDAFLVKLDSSGSRQWATYYGGNDTDGARDIDRQ